MPIRCTRIARSFLALAAIASIPAAAQTGVSDQAANAAATLHHIKTVFVIVMENHNWTGGSPNIKGNPAAPYINYTLLPMASYANNYKNPPGIHPSLPNYLWLEAGDTLGVHADGSPQQFHQGTHNHLVQLLENAGISWKAYDEDISGTVCPINNAGPVDSNGGQLYASRHDPFVYFDDQTNSLNLNSAICIQHIRPFTQLAADLAANKQASYNFITPNLCDDMHDSCGGDPVAHGDAWLKQKVPAILNSTAYRSGGALFIVWDEAATGDGPIPMIVLSPFAKGNHYSNNIYYTHSSTLRTLQEIFGVSPLIRYASALPDLSDLFHVFP
ncbi:MAG TPA: alkaline phosphatase family protein [Terracidiphilus sp.]|jgi:phospholipase C